MKILRLGSHTHCDGGCREIGETQDMRLLLVSYRPLAKTRSAQRGKLLGGKEEKDHDLGRHGHVLAVPVEPVNIQLVRG